MVRFEKFEDEYGKDITINPKLVCAVTDSGCSTEHVYVDTVNNSYKVKGTVTEVTAKLHG